MSAKILVVDDEASIVEILKYNLEVEGYEVDYAYSAIEALGKNLEDYDLFFLDIMMDGMSGYDFAKLIRGRETLKYVPIIFCSALSGEDERIRGLNIGGDDYITKPFRIRELIARTRSVLRRADVSKRILEQNAAENSSEKDISFKGLHINFNSRLCKIDDVPVKLTKTEFELAYFFFSHRNNIYSRQEIIANIWDNEEEVSTRAIDTNITRLRKKLGPYGDCIITRLGYGYGFEEQ